MANSNMHAAKTAKNDEFYTQLSDIEKELYYYRDHFKDKVVYCNCDDPERSNFWQYFSLNFFQLGLKKLVSTHYSEEAPSYKLEFTPLGEEKIPLVQNGDFRSVESIEILKECDIVVTNPPFSLFREYVAQLMEYKKNFLIIGSTNAITYKEIFPLLKDNQMWMGYNHVKSFMQPDGSFKKFGNINWYTNLDIQKRHEDIILYKLYTPEEYPTYDNYNAINVDKVKDIPVDFDEAMGVPITFMDKYSPSQFEILGITDRANSSNLQTKKYTAEDSLKFRDLNARSVLKLSTGYRAVYARILIQKL